MCLFSQLKYEGSEPDKHQTVNLTQVATICVSVVEIGNRSEVPVSHRTQHQCLACVCACDCSLGDTLCVCVLYRRCVS